MSITFIQKRQVGLRRWIIFVPYAKNAILEKVQESRSYEPNNRRRGDLAKRTRSAKRMSRDVVWMSRTEVMGKKRTKASDQSEAAVVERAKSLANQWMWAVVLQHDRITRPRPQDKAFHSFNVNAFNEADVHFLVIALRRLRTVAATLEHAPQVWDSVRSAIQAFDDRLPWLKRLRDVFEHLEDYAVDSNLRWSDTSRWELQAWSAGENGMQWLGYDVDWNEGLFAAKSLYAAVKTACDSLASQGGRPNDQAQDGGSG